MKLSLKLLVALGGFFAAYTAVNAAVQKHFVTAEFERLERQAARDDLRRCQEAIANEVAHLSVKTRDWAYWDDTYRFVADRNAEYADSNLKEDAFEVSDFHLLYVVNAEGEVVWGGVRDLDYKTALQLQAFPADRWPTTHTLLHHRDTQGFQAPVQGVQLTEHGPLLVCAQPILTSQGAGPARGTFVMGRFLAAEELARLRAQTRVDFTANRVDTDDLPPPLAAARGRLEGPDDVLIEAEDAAHLRVCGYVHGHEGEPALLLAARISRDISRQGALALRWTLFSTAVAAVAGCALLFILLRTLVVSPLKQLTWRAEQIGRTGDLSQRVTLQRRDEIGRLSQEFDGMVASLAEARAKLIETSRIAGMADVASGVLHNIGNVLNSVNVSTTTLIDHVRKSKVTGLARAAELLEKNRADMLAFITQDERGRNLPAYVCQVAQVLVDEQHTVLGELGNLKTSVDHVNQVVQSQHMFANRVGHVEPTNLRELVTSALAIMEAGFKRHGVTVSSDLAETPTILLDAGKCLQVLINILTNAKEALGALPKGEKRLDVRLRVTADQTGVVEVTDNGVGIARENLTRIFSNGFTTKPSGRGYGLHYSGVAARELGGALTAQSAGPGCGACFTLALPLRLPVEASA